MHAAGARAAGVGAFVPGRLLWGVAGRVARGTPVSAPPPAEAVDSDAAVGDRPCTCEGRVFRVERPGSCLTLPDFPTSHPCTVACHHYTMTRAHSTRTFAGGEPRSAASNDAHSISRRCSRAMKPPLPPARAHFPPLTHFRRWRCRSPRSRRCILIRRSEASSPLRTTENVRTEETSGAAERRHSWGGAYLRSAGVRPCNPECL